MHVNTMSRRHRHYPDPEVEDHFEDSTQDEPSDSFTTTKESKGGRGPNVLMAPVPEKDRAVITPLNKDAWITNPMKKNVSSTITCLIKAHYPGTYRPLDKHGQQVSKDEAVVIAHYHNFPAHTRTTILKEFLGPLDKASLVFAEERKPMKSKFCRWEIEEIQFIRSVILENKILTKQMKLRNQMNLRIQSRSTPKRESKTLAVIFGGTIALDEYMHQQDLCTIVLAKTAEIHLLKDAGIKEISAKTLLNFHKISIFCDLLCKINEKHFFVVKAKPVMPKKARKDEDLEKKGEGSTSHWRVVVVVAVA
uniref:Uncharacterized protein n=1 Tax=Oryza punctata TaxID=4537 RepID=A0A0E0JTI6_ORYPU